MFRIRPFQGRNVARLANIVGIVQADRFVGVRGSILGDFDGWNKDRECLTSLCT